VKRNNSDALQRRAARVMPLGVNSNSRYWGGYGNLSIEKAKGATVWDVDGRRYIDYRLAFGPVILGYAYDEVDEQVIAALHRGVTVGLTRELEIRAAERVVAMCPSVEMVRFVNSGTEASLHALRLARAFTGREKIIKFEGGYHGSHDYVLFSTYTPPAAYGSRTDPIPVPASSGIPAHLRHLVITLPFNDPHALESVLRRAGHEVAAILTEPMLGNYGAVDPLPGFLQFLRQKCDQYGLLLVFDEVKTGFRIAPGGAAEFYGVLPDLAIYAKAMGNGYPVAAFGGRKEIMVLLGRGVSQGGTYAGNAVAAAAVDATLGILGSQPVHATINARGVQLQNGLRGIFADTGIQAHLTKHPAIFAIHFNGPRVVDARSWAACDHVLYRRFARALLERGILIDPDPREPWCLCYSHSEADIEETLSVVKEVVQTLDWV
jgi:glutamate-1-semialdehyde 2,1-aminomutase